MALQQALARAGQDLVGDLRIFPEARARIEVRAAGARALLPRHMPQRLTRRLRCPIAQKELGVGTTDLLRQLLPLVRCWCGRRTLPVTNAYFVRRPAHRGAALATQYRERALPVVSGFHVAAIGLGRSGTVYGGVRSVRPHLPAASWAQTHVGPGAR